ncbi:MAG: type II toxin-antitoxin system RatA family toxin [Proteobacteria bacterium]|nr:type II toxin-antitoxin system RatA family toxin [Pseudomonadota bacterium]
MIHFNETRVLSFYRKNIVSLVLDVDTYKEFLPWVVASSITERGENYFTGYLEFSYMGMQKGYLSRTIVEEPSTDFTLIKTMALDGPFKSLKSLWHIKHLNDHSCHIDYSIDIAFLNPMYQTFFSKVFNDIAKQTINAFEERAQTLYI